MLIFPAIDLMDGKAVRLYKGDYAQMTVYSDDPPAVARDFAAAGAEWMHVVDLEGARSGTQPNLQTVCAICAAGLKVEVGGGIRSMEAVRTYLDAGVSRVIIGTAAVTNEPFLREALDAYGERIAVGVDLRDGYVSIHGWTETSALAAEDFCLHMQSLGVRTVISTDISRDGAMQGANTALYRRLNEILDLDLIASGGVSSMDDILRLREMGMYGAIIGKAYYTGAIDLREAIARAK